MSTTGIRESSQSTDAAASERVDPLAVALHRFARVHVANGSGGAGSCGEHLRGWDGLELSLVEQPERPLAGEAALGPRPSIKRG